MKNHSITADEYVINSHLTSHMKVDKLSEDDMAVIIEILDEKDKEEKHDILRKIQNQEMTIGDLLEEVNSER